VKDQPRRPGTLLYEDRDRGPVMGWLVIMRGRRRGTDFRISKDTLVIGREGSSDVALDDETASRQHVRIRREKKRFVLFDLGSSNGTFVNRERVQRHELEDGDVIRVGETLLLFKEAKPGPKWSTKSTTVQETAEEEV
jgi:pSer/pThr/pTyr-binding forkhead associated (FHA) protein